MSQAEEELHGKATSGWYVTNATCSQQVRNIHATLRAVLKGPGGDGVIVSNPAEKVGKQLQLVTPIIAGWMRDIAPQSRVEPH